MKNLGYLKGNGKIKVETLDSFGMLETEGEIEGETITIKGLIQSAHLINGECVTIVPMDKCKVGSIGATHLTVRQRDKKKDGRLIKYVNTKNPSDKCCLDTAQIEGDYLDISSTTADMVCGDEILIGKNSIIGRVEYTGAITVDPTAVIKEQIKRQG